MIYILVRSLAPVEKLETENQMLICSSKFQHQFTYWHKFKFKYKPNIANTDNIWATASRQAQNANKIGKYMAA